MKTSHTLLAIITLVALTGMVATDVLLKQQYEKIDWSNPYQTFKRQSLPSVRHVVIEADPAAEVIVERGTKAQALQAPSIADSYRTRRQGDTLYMSFTTNFKGERHNPRDNSWGKKWAGLVLRLPTLESLRITNGCLTLQKLTSGPLTVSLRNTRLRTEQVAMTGVFNLIASRNSFAVLGNDRYESLRTVVQDSSGVRINDSQIGTFVTDVSPKAEVQLRGQALKWLK